MPCSYILRAPFTRGIWDILDKAEGLDKLDSVGLGTEDTGTDEADSDNAGVGEVVVANPKCE